MNHKIVTLFVVLMVGLGSASCAEEKSTTAGMSQQQLHALIKHYGDEVKVNGNRVQFTFDDVQMLLVSDANADRMRIISSIAHISKVEPQMVIQAMAANFHSVLDARYALGDDGTIYSAYIHPLSPLTEQQLLSALRQVASAQTTFGSTFSSGEMVFPGSEPEQAPPPPDSV